MKHIEVEGLTRIEFHFFDNFVPENSNPDPLEAYFSDENGQPVGPLFTEWLLIPLPPEFIIFAESELAAPVDLIAHDLHLVASERHDGMFPMETFEFVISADEIRIGEWIEVPEPSVLVLVLAALAGLVGSARYGRKVRA